jgi:hypothetical protein
MNRTHVADTDQETLTSCNAKGLKHIGMKNNPKIEVRKDLLPVFLAGTIYYRWSGAAMHCLHQLLPVGHFLPSGYH